MRNLTNLLPPGTTCRTFNRNLFLLLFFTGNSMTFLSGTLLLPTIEDNESRNNLVLFRND